MMHPQVGDLHAAAYCCLLVEESSTLHADDIARMLESYVTPMLNYLSAKGAARKIPVTFRLIIYPACAKYRAQTADLRIFPETNDYKQVLAQLKGTRLDSTGTQGILSEGLACASEVFAASRAASKHCIILAGGHQSEQVSADFSQSLREKTSQEILSKLVSEKVHLSILSPYRLPQWSTWLQSLNLKSDGNSLESPSISDFVALNGFDIPTLIGKPQPAQKSQTVVKVVQFSLSSRAKQLLACQLEVSVNTAAALNEPCQLVVAEEHETIDQQVMKYKSAPQPFQPFAFEVKPWLPIFTSKPYKLICFQTTKLILYIPCMCVILVRVCSWTHTLSHSLSLALALSGLIHKTLTRKGVFLFKCTHFLNCAHLYNPSCSCRPCFQPSLCP
eukprot:m.154860 g.154860  ORF g.154860 m.154860 type:complete len:389 (-) comp14301_c6_seq1:778-1944(-)